ncbi:MAG TPA: DegT/DnrJ/EryC1/StrS family aminotransferase [Planctomycetota bacterium]|nr:DegT/DnrJ/EryC1/StrS family aminotransferase [Planctomycetota bacterium]
MRAIPLSRPYLTDEVRQAALRALDSGRYILDRECRAFEEELAAHTGTKHAVLSSSWTAAVLLLHEAMEVAPGDEILVPSHTAFPSIEPMIHRGARPVFVDIDDTYCVDPAKLEAALTPRTVGILPVHLYGHPGDLDRIFEVARRHDLWVVEDCAQAQGAEIRGRRVGSLGIVGAFSFFPSKNLTVLGDGGCLCTNDDGIAERVRMLRNHGRRSKYEHELVGYNLRFNEVQAAVGRVMLRHLDELNDRRRAVARRYDEVLKGIVGTPPERPWAKAVYHMYVVRAPRRDELAKALKERGIETGIHYPIPNHRQPAVTERYRDLPGLPETERAVGEILSLPIHGTMPLEDADAVANAIAEFYDAR